MKIAKIAPLLLLPFFFFFSTNVEASANTTISQQVKQNYDDVKEENKTQTLDEMKNNINDSKERFDFNGSLEKIQSMAIPLLVAVVIFSAILFILGWLVPPLRMKAWSLIGLSMISYVLIVYPHNIVGAMMASLEWIVSIFFTEG